MATKRHYHVGYNIPGYLPEMDPYTVSSKREAIAAVADEARRLNDNTCMVESHNGKHGPYVKRGGNGDIWLEPRECAGTGASLHVWYSGPYSDAECECNASDDD